MEEWAIPAAAGISFTLGAAWRDWQARSSQRRARQAACDHTWGPVQHVENASLIRFPEAWVRFCEKCRLQLDCNEDGTPYVPKRDG